MHSGVTKKSNVPYAANPLAKVATVGMAMSEAVPTPARAALTPVVTGPRVDGGALFHDTRAGADRSMASPSISKKLMSGTAKSSPNHGDNPASAARRTLIVNPTHRKVSARMPSAGRSQSGAPA